MTRLLCISFTGLLRELSEGALRPEELEHALFYFGCIREHAMAPGASGESDERNYFKGGHEAHAALVPILQRAEAEGRVAWRERGERSSYQTLNGLLERNGLKRLPEAPSQYSYVGVVHDMAEANPDVRVVA